MHLGSCLHDAELHESTCLWEAASSNSSKVASVSREPWSVPPDHYQHPCSPSRKPCFLLFQSSCWHTTPCLAEHLNYPQLACNVGRPAERTCCQMPVKVPALVGAAASRFPS